MTSEPEETLAGQLRMLRLPEPERQYRFADHVGRKWAADFAWPEHEHRLLVEVDGGGFVGGRHTRGQGFENDAEKLNSAVLMGYRVLRVTPKQVDDGRAIEWIRQALA